MMQIPPSQPGDCHYLTNILLTDDTWYMSYHANILCYLYKSCDSNIFIHLHKYHDFDISI